MTIDFLQGHLGSGKSLRMVMQAYLDYYTGRILLANFHFKHLKYFYVRRSSLLEMLPQLNPDRSYTLFLDEAQVEVDGRNFWKEDNKEFSYFIAQVRKRNINVYYASQWKKGAETRIRELTDYWTRCKAIRNNLDANPKTNLLGFMYRKLSIEEDTVQRYFIPVKVAEFFYKYYDTKEVITPEKVQEKEMEN